MVKYCNASVSFDKETYEFIKKYQAEMDVPFSTALRMLMKEARIALEIKEIKYRGEKIIDG